MARILINVNHSETAELIFGVLTEAGHVLRQAPGTPDVVTGHVSEFEPDLIIMDYVGEDTHSVKIMQQTSIQFPFVKFIFVIKEGIGAGHLMLALNEGASALIPEGTGPERLLNYTTRALNQAQADKTRAEELDRYREAADREISCSAEQAIEISGLKRHVHSLHRLVNHLLVNAGTKRLDRGILLVSDSAYQLDLFREHLQQVDFQVFTAKDGTEGLAAARKHKPRIIISDLEMPGLNGLELCREIKNDPGLSPNHFIICTANEKKVDEVLKPGHHVDDCLLKPGGPEEFEEFTARVALGLLS